MALTLTSIVVLKVRANGDADWAGATRSVGIATGAAERAQASREYQEALREKSKRARRPTSRRPTGEEPAGKHAPTERTTKRRERQLLALTSTLSSRD